MNALTPEQVAAIVAVANGAEEICRLEDRASELYAPLLDALKGPARAALGAAEKAIRPHVAFEVYAPLDSALGEELTMEGRAMLIAGMLLASPKKALAMLGIDPAGRC